MTHRAGLAGQTAAGDGADDVVLAGAVGRDQRLLDHHAQHRTGEIDFDLAGVDDDLAGARLDPDAGDRVLALAGGIGAALLVELLDVFRRFRAPASSAPTAGRETAWCRPSYAALMFLRFIDGDVERLGLLGLMRMLGAGIDAQIAHLLAAERAAREHALDRLLDHALGEAALEDRLRGAFLDAADEAGVLVVDLVVALAAGEHHLLGVDDDDIVAAIDMRGVGRQVLAAQAHAR